MTLTDDLAAAEQRAREALEEFVSNLEEQSMTVDDGPLSDKALNRHLSRYAEACRLAGRWEALPGQQAGDRAELARLMEGCP